MIVIENHAGLLDILGKELERKKVFSLDCETTGLKWQKSDYAFLWSFATDLQEFVVDIRKMSPAPFYQFLESLLSNQEMHIIGTNTKFDLHMALSQRNADIALCAKISDTSILMRLCDSDAMQVGLAALGNKIGNAKDDGVKQWIQKNKAYRYEKLPNDELDKIPRYDAVPEEIIYHYAAQDARVSYDGYFYLLEELEKADEYNRTIAGDKSIFKALEKEEELLKVLFKIEQRGVLIDRTYTSQGLSCEENRVNAAREVFKNITGRDFIDSSKSIAEAFGSESDIVRSAPRTEKGNVSFSDSYLSSIDNPIAKAISNYREAYKKSGTYYSNFIHLQGTDGRVHTNFRQSQTSTGRLSASDPNLQNISNNDDSQYPIRGCFVSPEDFYMLSIDYQAQEMRVLIDMAGQEDVAKEVLNGVDLHEAAATLMGCSRETAKGIQFSIIYGAGDSRLSESLKISKAEATSLRRTYYSKLPKVSSFIQRVVAKAEKGRLSNIAGRIYKFDKKFAYKAVNYLVQGSSAEITKSAMIGCEKFLADKKSKLVLSVHDELLFYIHKNELDLIPQLASIMKNSYAFEILPMDVGIEIGTRWSEMEDYGTWLEKQKQFFHQEYMRT